MFFSKEELDEGKVLLVDKPLNWTSFQVVNKVRWHTRATKVGHAGTLDPLATGLLILCTGKKTKEIEAFQNETKEYIGTITLGATRPSYDKETEIDSRSDWQHIKEADIAKAFEQLTGEIEQFPPAFSAVKINGKRAYELARKGKAPELKARNITVYSFEITALRLPEVDFKVVCSKGTYIRSLAHDSGKILGCGAYLESLRRTASGGFRVEEAFSLDQLIAEYKR